MFQSRDRQFAVHHQLGAELRQQCHPAARFDEARDRGQPADFENRAKLHVLAHDAGIDRLARAGAMLT